MFPGKRQSGFEQVRGIFREIEGLFGEPGPVGKSSKLNKFQYLKLIFYFIKTQTNYI